METILRIFQVLLAIGLIGVVLLQRSEGGGLGIGSSGGMGSFMSVRGTANFLTRVTSILGGLFMATCLALALIGHTTEAPRSIFDAPASAPPEPAPAPAPAESPSGTVAAPQAGPAPAATVPAPLVVPPVVATPTPEIPPAPIQTPAPMSSAPMSPAPAMSAPPAPAPNATASKAPGGKARKPSHQEAPRPSGQ